MATKLVECVPNFSEGKNAEVIEAIAAAYVEFDFSFFLFLDL